MVEFVRCPKDGIQLVNPFKIQTWEDDNINKVFRKQGIIREGEQCQSAECPKCNSTLRAINFYKANDKELLQIIVQLQST